MSDSNDPTDKEHFGEASLGDAQAENAPNDPEMLTDESGDGPASEDELTDVPALEPAPVDATAIEEEEAAAAEAASIGGQTPAQDLDPAEQAVIEGGGGEAEGFEQAEDALVEAASHGDSAGNPLGDRFTPEDAASEGLATYGEADHVDVSEDDLNAPDD